MKICPSCLIEKPFDEFHRDMGKKDYCSTYCRVCARARSRKNYIENRDVRLAQQRSYKERNKESVQKSWRRYQDLNREKLADYHKEYHRRNREARILKYTTDINYRIKTLLSGAKQNAKARNLTFDVDLTSMVALFHAQSGRCALTSIDFEMSIRETGRTNPFAPSIDRIDCSKGYQHGNVWFVLSIVNMAKNEFSTADFDRMCRARVEMLDAG